MAIRDIGTIQCDWKYSQWILDLDSGNYVLIDLDDAEMIPADCSQETVQRHTPLDNFRTVADFAQRWNEESADMYSSSQFLRNEERGGYYWYDERFDIYKLGGKKYFPLILNMTGDCKVIQTELQELLNDINSIYPPTLEHIKNTLLELRAGLQ